MELVKAEYIQFVRSNLLQFISLLFLLLLVYAYYSFGSATKISGLNESIEGSKKDDCFKKSQNQDHLEKGVPHSVSKSGINLNTQMTVETLHPIDVMVTFAKAVNDYNIQTKFTTTVKSLFKFSTIPVNLYILGDPDSKRIANKILSEVADSGKYKVKHLEIDSLVKQVHEIVCEMQKYFSYRSCANYRDSLYFISLVMHKVLPDLQRVIMLDSDLKFNADIKELYDLFYLFREANIIGIAREAQPVYKYYLHVYINQNKGTRVGAPPPDGLTGFNSGVLLLDLERMRKSEVYNSLLNAESVKQLTEKYMFKGNYGDQDFFSLISLEHEELFHILPCNWNRQLCTWWKDHGYAEVFDQYFKCEGHINIYHGNYDSRIPKLEWES